jgi:hypothetical protein
MTSSLNPNLYHFYSLHIKFLDSRDFYDLPTSIELDNCLHRVKKDKELLKHISSHGRFIVFPKDVEVLYKEEVISDSREVLQEIRNKCNLPSGAPVLINDFCEYAGKDFPTVYKLMIKNHLPHLEVPTQLPAAWEKYYKTRDWYDLPDSIDAGNSLTKDRNGKIKKIKRGNSPQLIVYPQHIENYFKLNPEDALEYLQDIRDSKGLSIGTPVMIGDVNSYRHKPDSDFLFCIMGD